MRLKRWLGLDRDKRAVNDCTASRYFTHIHTEKVPESYIKVRTVKVEIAVTPHTFVLLIPFSLNNEKIYVALHCSSSFPRQAVDIYSMPAVFYYSFTTSRPLGHDNMIGFLCLDLLLHRVLTNA